MQTESGHQLASDVAIDAEFTFATNTEGMLSSITGAVDTSRVADEVVSVALTVPGLRTPQHVAADVPITWEVVDETLHLQLQSAAVLNRIVMDM